MATMNQYATVYAGPSTSTYPSIGSVSSGESVSVWWKEGNWYYIQYATSSLPKCGYVLASTVSGAGSVTAFTPSYGTRYVNTGSTTYYGPGSGYTAAGSVSRGESVSYLGYKYNGYAFIQYSVSGTSQKKRAFFWANYLSTTPPTK